MEKVIALKDYGLTPPASYRPGSEQYSTYLLRTAKERIEKIYRMFANMERMYPGFKVSNFRSQIPTETTGTITLTSRHAKKMSNEELKNKIDRALLKTEMLKMRRYFIQGR